MALTAEGCCYVAGDLLMVLCLTMASAVLSASFVVFLVREAESRSKHVQVVSGAPLTALWAATYAWDLLNFIIPAAGTHAGAITYSSRWNVKAQIRVDHMITTL